MKTEQSILDYNISRSKRLIAESMERLNQDFFYEFEWVGERMLIESIKLKMYTAAKEHGIELVIDDLEKYVSRSYNVIGTSTCQFRNLKIAVEFRTKMDVLAELKSLILKKAE